MTHDMSKSVWIEDYREHGRGGSNRAATSILACSAILGLAGFGCATTNENTARRELGSRDNPFMGSESGDDNDGEDSNEAPDGTLESYVAYAMRNSPELEALFERWQAGVNRIAQTRRLPDPVISYTFYIRNVETRVGPQRHRLSLKQSFPWPTRLSAGADAASARAQALQRQFDARAIAIQAAVEEKYWSLWGIQTVRKVHEDHFMILKGLSESAGALLVTGQIELADQQQIDLTAARTEDLLYALDEQAAEVRALLRGVIGAPQSMRVKVVSSPMFHDVTINERQLIEAVRNHPSIHVFEELSKASEAAANQEKASRFPTFSLGVDWIETGETSMPDVQDSGKDAVLVGVGISVPLWQRNYKGGVEAHRSESRAYQADGRAAVDRAVAEFHAVLADLRDTKRRMALYETTLVPQAESAFESVLGTYVSGKGSIAAILLAQRDLLQLKVQLIDIQTDHARKWAALENLVGRDVTTESPPPGLRPVGGGGSTAGNSNATVEGVVR